MRRGFNGSWFFKFVGVVALIVVLVHALNQFQVWRNAQSLLEYAEDSLAKERPREAIDFLGRYLLLRPRDLAALERYADLLEKNAFDGGELYHSAKLREKLLLVLPDRHDARYRLAAQYGSVGRRGDARQHYLYLLKEGWGEADDLRQKIAETYIRDDKGSEAAEQLRLAVQANPQRVEAWLLLAEDLQQILVQPEEAQKALADMIRANPKSAPAFLGRSKFNLQLNPALAEKDLQEALRLAPDDLDVLLAAAQSAQRRSEWEAARKHLFKAQSLHPEAAAVAKAVWSLELRAGRKAEARKALEKGLKVRPDDLELRLLLADVLIDEGKADAAREVAKELRSTDILPGLPDFLEARLLADKGQWSDALVFLEKARTDLAEKSDWIVRVWGLIAYCHERLGDLNAQLRAYGEAVRLDPNWTAARFGLGVSQLAAGRSDDAIAELTRVEAAGDAPARTWIMLARAWTQKNRTLPAAERNWLAVDQALAKAEKNDPQGIESASLRADVLSQRGKHDEARKVLDAIQKKFPDDASLWTLRAEVEQRRGGIADAFAVLDAAVRKTGDRVEYRQLRARLLALRPETVDRQLLHELARRLEGFDDDAKIRLYRDLADAWLRVGDAGIAEHYWRLVAQKRPNDATSRIRLVEIALAEDRVESAKTWIDAIRRIEGEGGVQWRIAEVALAIRASGGDAAKLDAARTDLKRLRQGREDWALIPLLFARIEESQGKQDEALAYYAKAAELGNHAPAVLGRMAKLLAERERFQEAELALRRLEETNPLTRDLAKLGAEVAVANGNAERALSLLPVAADPKSRDYRDLIWRAQIFRGLKNNDAVERELRRATELAPHASESWAALVGHLALAGRAKDAAAVVETMRTRVAKSILDLALARCALATGDFAKTEKLVQEAIKQKPNDFLRLSFAADFYRQFDRADQAAPLYRRLLDPKLGAPAEIVVQARRKLASILAEPNPAEAIALLERAAVPETTDQRLRWYLEGADPSQRKASIQRFESSLTSSAPTVDERVMLAKLYEADGRIENAREILQKTAAHHADGRLLAYYVRFLTKSADPIEAQAQLDRLARQEPESPRVRDLRTALEKARPAATP